MRLALQSNNRKFYKLYVKVKHLTDIREINDVTTAREDLKVVLQTARNKDVQIQTVPLAVLDRLSEYSVHQVINRF